jgi:hypothetical protein
MAMVGTILSLVGWIGALIFGIQILIHAFKTSVGWGIASLLIPFVIFVYAAKHWGELKTPTLRMIGCMVLGAIGSAIGVFSAVSGAFSEMPPAQ